MEAFRLTSPELVEQGIFPVKYTDDNPDKGTVSPPLSWSNPPAGARSFALGMVDPSLPVDEEWFNKHGFKPGMLPADLFIHWVVFDIPSSVTSLAEGTSPGGSLPAGAKELNNSASQFGAPRGYISPGPPRGHKAHAYIFTLYALNVEELGLPANAGYPEFIKALRGKVLAAATLTAYFGH